ncbi:egg cell-secreted protein 1.4-like [Papaver somniferum]|uniref:egg cell-secreted protein 1.4-like n=1 Tax=Papaver somniferum TaxID=3469 RepID=UPI000E6F93DE|nr:egg cell-secreted protein 1.4-like [Papaver somniferum]
MAPAYLTTASKLIFITMLVVITLSTMDSNTIGTTGVLARPLSHVQTASPISLAARLQSNGSYSECWDSLTELQACTGEVILFFLNGEAHLGRNCCRAIHIIQHNCWPAMLGSLGFTQEEGEILRGYCDATANVLPPPSPIVLLVKDDMKP